jgi:hypothetical protein
VEMYAEVCKSLVFKRVGLVQIKLVLDFRLCV